MASQAKRITLSEPGIAGSYELVERRADGTLLLRPERELLSQVIGDSDGRVFRDEENPIDAARFRSPVPGESRAGRDDGCCSVMDGVDDLRVVDAL